MEEKKINIFGIGITGLVGSRIVELLPQFSFQNLSLETGVNITEPTTLNIIRNDTEHSIVLHLAAKADVDGCEKDKVLGESGDAYKINVLGTQNIVDACREKNKKIIYISTDFVFDGQDTPEGGYTEESIPHPLNWYAETKLKGEEIVKNSGLPFLIVRIAYPYRSEFAAKKDFVHAIAERLKNKQSVAAITDHVITPTLIDDMALALEKLITTDASGIYHVVGSQSLTPYEAAFLIAEKFGGDTSLISKTTRADFFKDRAPRPFNLSLNNDKIKKLGVPMRTFEEGLKTI
jgi:dTDP-4-dehydrorhamnose reductase